MLNPIGLDTSRFNNGLSKFSDIKSTLKSASQSNSNSSEFNRLLQGSGKIDSKTMNPRQKKLYDTCLDMEGLLWKQVLGAMRKTVGKHKLIDGGKGEEIFNDFLYDEYADMMAKHGSSKVAETMYNQLSLGV